MKTFKIEFYTEDSKTAYMSLTAKTYFRAVCRGYHMMMAATQLDYFIIFDSEGTELFIARRHGGHSGEEL